MYVRHGSAWCPWSSEKGGWAPWDCTYRGSWTTMDARNQTQVSGESNKCFSTDPDLQPLNNYFQIIFSFFLNHVSVWTYFRKSSLASWEKWSKVRCLLAFCIEIFVLQFYMRKQNVKCCLWKLYSQQHSSFYLGKMKSESFWKHFLFGIWCHSLNKKHHIIQNSSIVWDKYRNLRVGIPFRQCVL